MARRLLAINPVNDPGGAETTLMRFLSRLPPRGWEVTVTTPGPGPLSELAQHDGHNWQPLPLGGILPRQGARSLLAWPRARWLAEQHDVTYLNGVVTGRVLPAIAASSRTALHIHDMVRRTPRIWRLADVVLADSRAVAARLRGIAAVEVVHLPVELDPPRAAAPWGEADAGPVVGYVGRIEPRKGVLDLIAAAPAVRAAVPGVRMVIVGGDPHGTGGRYVSEVRAAAAGAGFAQHGWSDNAPGLMRHLDVLVLPSYEEPFGTVLAEAMAVGTPVVATRVDGLPEVVEDGVSGRLVAPGRPNELAAAIVEVLADRERFAAAARVRAARFAIEGYVERVEGLLNG
jgi:glycosyltransferase involved in cell wall biosynthesis